MLTLLLGIALAALAFVVYPSVFGPSPAGLTVTRLESVPDNEPVFQWSDHLLDEIPASARVAFEGAFQTGKGGAALDDSEVQLLHTVLRDESMRQVGASANHFTREGVAYDVLITLS